MAKYRLLSAKGYNPTYFETGGIYSDDDCLGKYHVRELVVSYPFDWKLIQEEPMCTEKTIKLSLDQAKKMYGKNPEMDELLLSNFSKDELTKKELPKKWEELPVINGFFVTYSGDIGNKMDNVKALFTKDSFMRCTFKTLKQAKSALAMAQLSQLMAVYNDGWEPNWMVSDAKYIINRENNRIVKSIAFNHYQFLAFKSIEIRDEFLENFEPLIKEYFMID